MNGNSAAPIGYSFTDVSWQGEKQYYRLRQVDLDGRIKLSNVIIIKGGRADKLSLSAAFPNPVQSRLNVMADAPGKGNVDVVIIDAAGRVVKTQKSMVDAGTNALSFDVSALSRGSYIIKLVLQPNGESAVGKFVKE